MGAGPMKFQKGNKLAKGGKRNPPGGRPSTRELKEIARAADRAREKLERKFEAITDCYTDLATDREHEATTRHAMEKYVCPVEENEPTKPLIVHFIQFGSDQPAIRSAIDVSPTPVPDPILAGNGDRKEASGLVCDTDLRTETKEIVFCSFSRNGGKGNV